MDGKYGSKTKGALKRFAKQANLQFTTLSNINMEFLAKLRDAPSGYCPKIRNYKLRFASGYYPCGSPCGICSQNNSRSMKVISFGNQKLT